MGLVNTVESFEYLLLVKLGTYCDNIFSIFIYLTIYIFVDLTRYFFYNDISLTYVYLTIFVG